MAVPNHEDTVSAGRSTIDAIDGDIIRLVRQRQEVSIAVQRARMAAGEPRLQNAREISVFKRYGGDLGKPGTALATAILDFCRGRKNASIRP